MKEIKKKDVFRWIDSRIKETKNDLEEFEIFDERDEEEYSRLSLRLRELELLKYDMWRYFKLKNKYE